MKKYSKILFVLPFLVCFSCSQTSTPPHEHTYSETYSHDEHYHWQESTCEHKGYTRNFGDHIFDEDGKCTVCSYQIPEPPVIYDEEEDSTEGIDVSDLSHLKEAFSIIGENYTLTNNSHFTEHSLEVYKNHYGNDYSQETSRLFTNDYLYTITDLEEYQDVPELNKVYKYIDGGKTYSYASEDLRDAISFTPSWKADDGRFPFKLSNVNEQYFKDHVFTRVSKFKYISEDLDVIDDFLELCCPTLENEGYYMTYSKVSIEVDNYDAITRIRIYASVTQSAKLTENFVNPEYKNWYLMFNETLVSDINKTSVSCLENL